MTVTLRPYQAEAAERIEAILRTHKVCYLAGQVRVGKSITAMQVVKSIGYSSVLLVTKKKAIASIEADRDAMGLTDIVTVINFEQLHKYRGKSYGLLICDEAHGVGSFPKPSKRYKDIQGIHKSAVLLMSGTPSPESYSQLYHQFALGGGSSPWAAFKNFYQWAQRYVNIKEKYVGTGQKVNDYSDANKQRIFADIRHLVVRMTQEQAGFETQIEEHVHLVKMKPRTYRIAVRILKDGVIGKPGRRAIVADTGAKMASKVQQVYGGAVITEEHGPICFDRSKAEYVAKKFAGSKHAILYRFTAEGDMLKVMYEGRWTDSPEQFNAEHDLTYIGQVQASREGVNLSSADDLVMVGIDFAALSYLQGINRAAYLGRTRANRVHWIFAQGGIEPKVYDVVKAKEDFTQSHFKKYKAEHDRSTVPSQADQAIRSRWVDGDQAGADQQGGLPRPAAAAAL